MEHNLKVPKSEFEIDSPLEKSFGAMSSYPALSLCHIGSAFMSKKSACQDSNTSQCNFDTVEEKNQYLKTNFLSRDFIIKNSFNEWAPNGDTYRANT